MVKKGLVILALSMYYTVVSRFMTEIVDKGIIYRKSYLFILITCSLLATGTLLSIKILALLKVKVDI
jgi:hypothetical protein